MKVCVNQLLSQGDSSPWPECHLSAKQVSVYMTGWRTPGSNLPPLVNKVSSLSFHYATHQICKLICIIVSHIWHFSYMYIMRRSRKFCQRGSNFHNVYCCCYFSWWGEEGSKCHHKRAIICPPLKRHLNGVSLACRCWSNIECWLGSFVIFQGIPASFAKKSNIFVIFYGGSGHPVPPLDRPCTLWLWLVYLIEKHYYS